MLPSLKPSLLRNVPSQIDAVVRNIVPNVQVDLSASELSTWHLYKKEPESLG